MKCFLALSLVLSFAAVHSHADSSRSDSDDRVAQGEKLSDTQHYTDSGEHDHTYDHEAFLGKDRAEQFQKLTPEESRRRLGIIVGKIDSNKDGQVDLEELTYWIKHSLKKKAFDNAEEQMEYIDQDSSGDVEFQEYLKATFSHMLEESRLDEYADKYRLVTIREQIERYREAWSVADEDKNGRLTTDELAAFLTPSDFSHMNEVTLLNTLYMMDLDKDGFVTKEEYINDIYNPERDGADTPYWLESEIESFDTHRDTDGNGKLDREELRRWIVPNHYDPFETEAKHLIQDSDTDQNGVLSKDEILDHQDTFVASRATGFGHQLTKHDEF